jgi:HlyD family secretion protein
MKSKPSARWIWIVLGLVVVLGGGLFLFIRFNANRTAAAAAQIETTEVVRLTAIESIEASGTLATYQSATLTWKVSGQISEIKIAVGQRVKAGDTLMTLAVSSAPQSILQAQVDLINAQKTLDDLLQPSALASALAIANQQKVIVDARDQLDKAQSDLKKLKNPDLAYYRDQVAKAQENLTVAQQNAEISTIDNTQKAVTNAEEALKNAQNQLQTQLNTEAQYPGCCTTKIEDAQKKVAEAENNLRVAQLRLEQAQNNNADSIATAQDKLQTAQYNLRAAQQAPDALDLEQKETAVTVAQAKLEDAIAKLEELKSGSASTDIEAARLRVQAIEATLAQLTLQAPFDGEVIAIYNLPGDLVNNGTQAVLIANRSKLHVDVQVDETEIARLQVGNTVTVTFDVQPDLAYAGKVVDIGVQGQTVQGLVKYTVRVELDQSDSQPAFLGATANAMIVTAVEPDALAVPLDAVQNDSDGEYVNKVGADNSITRVNIVSGQLSDRFVVIRGDLQAGDKVQINVVATPQFNGPFGGGN